MCYGIPLISDYQQFAACLAGWEVFAFPPEWTGPYAYHMYILKTC